MQEKSVLLSVKGVFHVIGSISFAFGCYYDWNYVNVPRNVHQMGVNFAGKLKFLTFWDALIQTLYFTLCIIVDITGSSKIRKIKDRLHSCVAFPVAMFVGITFWALYAVDRELVFPRVLDQYFPVWLNHLMHTNIMIFTVVETVTTFRQYPNRKTGLKMLTLFMTAYLIWIHIIYFASGFWVYPVMEVLNTPLRIVFFVTLLLLAAGLYVVGETLNNKVWAKRLKSMKQS